MRGPSVRLSARCCAPRRCSHQGPPDGSAPIPGPQRSRPLGGEFSSSPLQPSSPRNMCNTGVQPKGQHVFHPQSCHQTQGKGDSHGNRGEAGEVRSTCPRKRVPPDLTLSPQGSRDSPKTVTRHESSTCRTIFSAHTSLFSPFFHVLLNKSSLSRKASSCKF